jgi:hypothetical protein
MPVARVEYNWLVATAFVAGVFMDLMDSTVVNVALLYSLRFLREHTEPAAGRFDLWGFLCSGGGLALIL